MFCFVKNTFTLVDAY